MAKQAKNRARNAARNLGSGMVGKTARSKVGRSKRLEDMFKKTKTKYR